MILSDFHSPPPEKRSFPTYICVTTPKIKCLFFKKVMAVVSIRTKIIICGRLIFQII